MATERDGREEVVPEPSEPLASNRGFDPGITAWGKRTCYLAGLDRHPCTELLYDRAMGAEISAALWEQIKKAYAADGRMPNVDARLADLLPAIRKAVAADGTELDDATLAKRVSDELPTLVARVKRRHDDLWGDVKERFPWVLQALEWDADLLGAVYRSRSETTHTRALAYFLDSAAPHELGAAPLFHFLRLVASQTGIEDRIGNMSLAARDPRLDALRVFAEHPVEVPFEKGVTADERRCDLWLELVEPERALVIVIENKVGAGEHGGQLAAYEAAVWSWARERRLSGFDHRLIFLTPDGRPPDGEDDHGAWTSISYRQLAAALALGARDAPHPGGTLLLLYVSSLLKSILGITNVENANLMRRVLFMREVLKQGGVDG